MLETDDILRLAVERASALNGLWNLFLAVVTAVVGVLAAGKSFTGSRSLKICLTIVFVAFAIANLGAMIDLGNLRRALVGMLPADLPPDVTDSLRPWGLWQYVAFHLFLDVIVIVAIWRVPWRGAEASGGV